MKMDQFKILFLRIIGTLQSISNFYYGRCQIPFMKNLRIDSNRLRKAIPFGIPSFKRSKTKDSESKKESPKTVDFETDEIGYLSDIGKIREIDEDSVFVAKTYSNWDGRSKRNVLMIVADGMGGHSKGEVASALGVTTVTQLILPKLITNNESDYSSMLSTAIKEANKKILEKSIECVECEGMGTTMTAVIIENEDIHVGHVGDTRAYLFPRKK